MLCYVGLPPLPAATFPPSRFLPVLYEPGGERGWEDADECVSGNIFMFTSQKEKKEKTFKSTVLLTCQGSAVKINKQKIT